MMRTILPFLEWSCTCAPPPCPIFLLEIMDMAEGKPATLEECIATAYISREYEAIHQKYGLRSV